MCTQKNIWHVYSSQKSKLQDAKAVARRRQVQKSKGADHRSPAGISPRSWLPPRDDRPCWHLAPGCPLVTIGPAGISLLPAPSWLIGEAAWGISLLVALSWLIAAPLLESRAWLLFHSAPIVADRWFPVGISFLAALRFLLPSI